MWGDFSSFLEMVFAINVMFCIWPKPGEILTKWLIDRARQAPDRLEGRLERVSTRIYRFQERCAELTPKWRWMAGTVALVILVLQLVVPSTLAVAWWGRFLLACLTFPIVGAASDLGLRARSCMLANRRELQPQRTRIGLWNVADIAGQITRPSTETEDPSDKDGGGPA